MQDKGETVCPEPKSLEELLVESFAILSPERAEKMRRFIIQLSLDELRERKTSASSMKGG